MAQPVPETQAELPPVQKYMQAMAVCNGLALLASQNAMIIFVQRISLLKKLQTCWTKGCEAEILVPDGLELDIEGEAVNVKLEPYLARVIDQQLPLTTENGESSDETVVDEPLACSAVSCDDVDLLKAEAEAIVEEKPVVKKATVRMGLRTKAKVQKDDTMSAPKRKRGRPAKPKKTPETREPVEKQSRCEAKEEVVEDSKSSPINFLCVACKESFATFTELKEHKAEAHDISIHTKTSKRRSHTADFKLRVIKRAKVIGNRAAGREFEVSETSIRDWRKSEQELEKMNPRRRSRRGQRPKWPTLEHNLAAWVMEQRDRNRFVSTVAIRSKALLLSIEMNIDDFNGGSYNWVYQFMRRNRISAKERTAVGRRLPNEWEKKLEGFREFLHQEINRLNLTADDVINMDEVPMTFEIPATRSVAKAGVKTVATTTAGRERMSFTVVLACAAGGKKIKPMVIFKRATMPAEKLPSGIVVVCNKKGWVNPEVMWTWTEKCFCVRPGAFSNRKSLLVTDAMTVHKEPSVQIRINAVGAHVAVIPDGLACKLQPLDVSVKHPFKNYLREEWDKWMTSAHACTPEGYQRRATYAKVCNWILTAWNKITVSTIANGFRKCGIMPPGSNAPLADSADEEYDANDDGDEENTSAADLHADENQIDRLNCVLDMFAESDDNDSFDGFSDTDNSDSETEN